MAADTVSVQIHGLRENLKLLDEIRQQVSARGVKVKSSNPLRAALRQAANVIMKQARANVSAIVAVPNVNGRDLSTGILRKAIKVRRPNRRYWKGAHDELIRVYIDHKMGYPAERAGDIYNRANDVGFLLEFGTVNRSPMPFMRPAFENKKLEAIEKFKEEFKKRFYQEVARLRASE